MSRVKYAVAVAGTIAGLLLPSVPAVAGGKQEPPKHCKHKQKCKPPKQKCNAGRGNDSEPTRRNDCDPGNSGGRNNGGD